MRILFQDLSGKSGAQASYRMLLQALANAFPNDQYFIICTKDSYYWSLGNLGNVKVIPFGRNYMTEWRRFYLEMFDIKRLANKIMIDVIWTINVGPYTRTGIPQVLMVLNSFQVYPWSFVRKYYANALLSLSILRWFFRRSISSCDAIMVEMPFLGEFIRQINKAPKWIESFPKAVETMLDFEPQPLSPELQGMFNGKLGRSTFTFLFVATCSQHKNQKTVITAIEILRKRGVNARLAVSSKEEQLRQFCDAKQVSSLIKSGHLLTLGWINKEQLAAVYAASDACVMPSHLEQLSSAHLEAMHWKKPQISSDLPYAHDLCCDASLYADPNNPLDWASQMQNLIENSELRDRLIINGLNRMNVFPKTWLEAAQSQRAFLKKVIAKHFQLDQTVGS